MKLHLPVLLFACLAAAACKSGSQAADHPETTAAPRPPPPSPPTTSSANPAPPAPDAVPLEPCPALRPMFAMFIRSQADDDLAQAAVTRCVESKALEGLPRAEVETLLGPGQPTNGMFDSFGVQPDDVFYEVGRFETPHPGGVPNLVLDYDAAGVCTRVLSIHSM
jgi:hypothetical protein